MLSAVLNAEMIANKCETQFLHTDSSQCVTPGERGGHHKHGMRICSDQVSGKHCHVMAVYTFIYVCVSVLPSGKESACQAEERVQSLGQESPGGGHGSTLQYFCLENPMNRGAWWATVHGVTRESDMTEQLNNNKQCVYVFLITLYGLWDLSSPIRDGTRAP